MADETRDLRQRYSKALGDLRSERARSDWDPPNQDELADAVLAVREEELDCWYNRAVVAETRAEAAERSLAAVREECDRITRWAHAELHDGFRLESVLETVQHIRAVLGGDQ